MELKLSRVFKLFLLSCFVLCCYGHVDNNPYRHREVLDSDGKYTLEWIVDWEKSTVIFNVTVQTRGYVGFGLSRKGKMSGADLVIGGVSNGKPYFTDRHAMGNSLPQLDDSQDWTLHSAIENGTHTFLQFSRPFETCDKDNDLPINDDSMALLWAYGENDDEIEYHHQNRGVQYAYLLDPDLVPAKLSQSSRNTKAIGDLNVWTIGRTDLMPAKDTTYVCSIHRPPRHNAKQHIVGFNAILESEMERKHVHHFLVHRCQVPAEQDPVNVFDRFVGKRGEECYILSLPTGRIPTQYCREVVYVWAVGGKPLFFPDYVGFPMHPNEYFLLQMHYTNTDAVPGINLKFALEIYYTGNLRERDGGMLTIGELTPASPSIMIPPYSLSHLIYGHCGSGCTEKILPREGIRVFAANLHTHLAGRGMRLIHIRDNKELPWISADDNYNFNYQQNRILRNELVVLPGDILINRCVYETTDRNATVTVGGFRTTHEMCNGFLWYYNKLAEYGVCRSELRSDVYKSFLQIWNTTWSDARIENIVTSPSHNAGLTVSEVGNRIDWTLSKRNQIQHYHRYLPQITHCPKIIGNDASSSSYRPFQRYPQRQGSGRVPVVLANNSVAENEIQDPEHEYITIYPKDIVPYERPDLCRWTK